MQEKSKIYNIHAKARTPPQTKPYGWKTPISPANQQIKKNQGVWRKCQPSVSQCLHTSSQCPPSLHDLLESGVSSQHVSSFCGRLNFGYWDGTGVIAHEGNSLKPHSKISHGVHYPKNMWAAASSSYIFGLGGGLCNWRLFSKRLANERRSNKMTSSRSSLSVNPKTHKISIEKANKIQRRRSRIPNPKLWSVFEILENLLNYRPMRRAWGSLKTRTQPHGELNV
jgi:hypothetical protein